MRQRSAETARLCKGNKAWNVLCLDAGRQREKKAIYVDQRETGIFIGLVRSQETLVTRAF